MSPEEREPFNFNKNKTPKKYVASKERMKCPQQYPMDEYGDAQAVANMVHHYIDWLRACEKRKWDTRPAPSALKMLLACQKGMIVNHATLLHYDEDPVRH